MTTSIFNRLRNIFRPIIYCSKSRPDEIAFLPQKRERDADYDLMSPYGFVIHPMQIVQVSTNIVIEFPFGWEAKLEDKSGLSSRGLMILGGVIDNNYRGEIIVSVINLGKTTMSIDTGQKLCQMKLRKVSSWFKFLFANRPLSKTDRGEGRHGSTGA